MVTKNTSEGSSNSILILEDSPTQAQELMHFLQEHGYQCLLAHNGQEGLKLLQSSRPVLIISDVMMPRMNGFEFCQKIKSDTSLKHIPVILLTSLSDTADIIRGLECGADNFVTKPYEKNYLLSRIDSLLTNRRLRSRDSHARGVEVEFDGKQHLITSERQQILDLLLSTYDQAVQINQRLKQRESELEASNARLSALHAIGSAVSQSLDLSKILNDALDKLIEVAGLDIAAILLAEGDHLLLKAYRNVPEEIARLMSAEREESNWIDRLNQINQPVVVPPGWASGGTELPTDICADVGRRLNCSSFMCVPLRSKGIPQGLLLSGTSYDHDFTHADIELMQGIGNQLAVALENGRLFEAERRSRKEAEAANRAKDEFLAIVSHELRTPLSAVLGWTRLLRGGKLDEQQTQSAIEAIERSGKSQVQLVNDLLDVSRMVAGKLILTLNTVDLRSILNEVIEDMQTQAATKKINLNTSFDNDVQELMGDSTRLRQVAVNLISNAIKFTPDGGCIDVTLDSKVNSSGVFAEIKVKDSGAGISPEFLPHVFERFRQADASNARQHGGLGLGLTIVRHIVELHKGSVSAVSKGLGLGATFIVTLPCVIATEHADHSGVPLGVVKGEDSSISLNGVKVLLVDDQNDARAVFTIMLNQYGADVTSVSTVAEALEVLQQLKPDVLVSDIAMPGEDGFKLIKRVRSLPPEYGGKVPAVALSATATKNDQNILAAGFQKHLMKPVDPAELASTVASVISDLNS
jgi:signal transduction histidine kinase/DNA-binding response OmpR family regulator